MIAPALAQQLQSIHARMQAGDLAGASMAMLPVLAGNPREPAVVQLAAMIRRGAGDLSGARAVIERGIAAGATSADLLNMLGNILGDLAEHAAADRAFADAAAMRPDHADPWINRGQLASRTGDHEAAVAHLRHACRIAPGSALAHVSLGNALRARGTHVEAVAMLRKAAAIDPRRATTPLHLGIALNAAGDSRAALAAYDDAARRGLATPELLANRAAALIELGELDAALDTLDALVRQHPAYLPGHRDRARLIWEYGIARDPFESYAELTRQFPGERMVWEAWAAALLGFRQYEAAIAVTGEACAALGDDPAIQLARAMAASECGLIDEADRAFAAAGSLSGTPLWRITSSRHLLRRGDPAEAAVRTQAVLADDPDNQLGWAYLGTAWRMLGDPREFWLHDYMAHTAQIEAHPPGDTDTDTAAFVSTTAAALRRLHVTRTHPADQTLRNGTQTTGALFDRPEPEIAALRAAVEDAVARFIAGLPDDGDHPMLRRKRAGFRFTGSWSVRLRQSGFHINHVHERGWISSAFYFALPPAHPDDPPHAGALQLGAPPDELGLGLPPRRIITPREGTLILFPSSMWHGTLPFAGDAERLTMAFDAVPVG
ncbi:putative 2OG-Fe(II) oxygenase [Sphingomonas sp.]|uniref:putative 2OG-Fe(II) oxygenase n=1 Tax=Sphingomonas sp. TaxID=28214 RepID=UPI001EC1649A|nr:putative 2OG-Fe(II) oxygenase [Sphingomonas sp.]MBX3593418.1 tetratricopeptide repeat protein [Sphingomonas sp.]